MTPINWCAYHDKPIAEVAMSARDFIAGLPNKAAIYRISNKHSGKFYIGSAVKVYRRISRHISTLKKGIHHNAHMQSAYDLYGDDAFDFEVVEFVDDLALLIEREQFWIDKLKAVETGYNKAPCAGSLRGYRHSSESRAAMSLSRKGRKMQYTPEGLQRILEARKNFRMSPESRQKISESKKGKPPTEAQMAAARRAGDARIGTKASEESKAKQREWNTGRKMPEGTGAKVSAAKKGVPRPAHAVEASAAWHRGRKDSPEVVAQRAESNRGKTRTPEQRARMSAGHAASKAKRAAKRSGGVATQLEMGF